MVFVSNEKNTKIEVLNSTESSKLAKDHSKDYESSINTTRYSKKTVYTTKGLKISKSIDIQNYNYLILNVQQKTVDMMVKH